jgi:small-conductance mechanosensitive channel
MELAFLSNTDIVKFIQVGGILPAVIIIALTFFLIRISRTTLDGIGDRNTAYRLLLKQVSVFLQFALLISGLFIALSMVLDINDDGFRLFIGLIVIGISWSGKDLIASLMAGVILLFDKPFQVGDRISFGEHYGEVKEIGLRTVRLIDLEDNLISIPNNQFLNGSVSSANAGNLDQMCVFQFFIGCNEDYTQAERIIYEVVSASRYVYWQKPIVVQMKEGNVPDGAERFAIILTAKAYVIDGRYESLFSSDVHKRIKKAFRSNNIRTAGEIEWGPQL